MIYDSQAHETNGHEKHSLRHAYSHNGEYLGHVDKLDLVTSTDAIAREYPDAFVSYDRDTGRTTVRRNGSDIIAEYENVYAQQIVILGQRKVA